MTTAATSLLGLALPVTGELAGTWGDTVNDSITSLLDTAVAGTTTLSTDGDVTLTTTTLAANQARQAILLCSGARTALRTITAPAQSKIYTIINATTGGYSVKLVGVGPTTGVTIVAGESALVAWNGSDFIKISNTSGGGTFTDLTVSNSLTLSYGTANGVLYSNASKVATSGSALTFDGTNLGVSGPIQLTATSTAPSANNEFVAYSTNGYTYLSGGTNGLIISNNSGADTRIRLEDANNIQFEVSSAEQMRLTSTGLGIGTSSPAYKLNVNGSAGLIVGWSDGTTIGALYSGGGYIGLTNSTAANGFFVNPTGVFCTIATGGAERMRLDSSGNLGIGVTSPSCLLDVETTSGSGRQEVLRVLAGPNATNNGASITIGSTQTICGYLSGLQTASNEGALVFGTQSSGAYAERARIDSSGNLLVGGTTATNSAAGRGNIVVNGSSSSMFNMTVGGISKAYLYHGGTDMVLDNVANGAMLFYTNDTERARIDSSGNLLVGTTTSGGAYATFGNNSGAGANRWAAVFGTNSASAGNPSSFGLTVGWNYSGGGGENNIIYGISAGSVPGLAFSSYNGTTIIERARIDSSGNLLVGTTDSAQTTGVGIKLQTSSTSPSVSVVTSTTTGGANYTYYSTGAGAYRFYVDSAGTVFATNTTISAISDIRYKENVRDLDVGLDKIMALKPRLYDWKEGKGANIKNARGFIAQEFEQVFPDLIDEWKDPAPEGEEPYKSVRQDLIPVLVKALQEMKTIIDQQAERIAALEAK